MVPESVFIALLGRYALKRWEKRTGTMSDRDRDNINELIGLYSQPHRGYHNLNHILHCLEVLEQCVADLGGETEWKKIFWKHIETAVWYHDAIYDPKAGHGQNELESAAVYRRHHPLDDEPYVSQLINATARHFEPGFDPTDLTMQLLLDIDLAGFAASHDEQAKLSADIRKEYAHVPEELYRVGRSRVLQTLLDRPFIYRSDYFRDRYETPARRNIASQILELSK
jgi:predicted metal-dependent HD superfamily phosphohydrolase